MIPIERIIFVVVFFLIIMGIQSLVVIAFWKFLKRRGLSKTLIKYLILIPFSYFNLPYFYFFLSRFDFSLLPKIVFNYYITPFFAFQTAILFIGLYILAGKMIMLPFNISIFIINKFKILKEKYENFKKKKNYVRYDKTRRTFITTSAIAVSGYAFIGAGVGSIRKNKYEIEYQTIKIKNLAEELKGTTISMISDIHSGPFMDYDTMKEYCDVINNLNSDFIFIPGDFTNTYAKEVHPFTKAFRDLKAKNGIYGTLGNHDYFSDSKYISDAIENESPIKMLNNEAIYFEKNGKGINIIGIEDIKDSGSKRSEISKKYLDITLLKIDSKNYDSPKILLSHKPYMFNEIFDRNIDLMLSGHTHGGQIVFLKYANLNLSIASTISNYISGLYSENGSQMYVSRGIGTVGFPIRLNCPPEITVFTLV